MPIAAVAPLLAAQRFESARRHCRAALETCSAAERAPLLRQLHAACVGLSDQQGCAEALAGLLPQDEDGRFDRLLSQAEDGHRFTGFEYYLRSPECRRSLSWDEFADLMRQRTAGYLGEARALATTPARRLRLAATLRRCRRHAEADALCALAPVADTPPSPTRSGAGALSGRLTMPDGSPVADALLTLGLEVAEPAPDPARYRNIMENDFRLACSALETLTARTDADGRYRFAAVPAGHHEFLAVNLDPQAHAIALRFLTHKLTVAGDTCFDAVVGDWQSAPPRPVASPFPAELVHAGVRCRRLGEDVLRNPFLHHFPRQALELALPAGADPARLLVLSSAYPEMAQPFQVIGGALHYRSDLPPLSDRIVAVYQAEQTVAPVQPSNLTVTPEADGTSAVIDTGAARLRIPWGGGDDALAPILAVSGPDGIWRGRGRLVLPAGVRVLARSTSLRERGPLLLSVEVAYALSNGASYRLMLTVHRDEGYVLVHEISPDLPGASFEFSLAEFLGGRGYLHWKAAGSGIHWQDLAPGDRLLCRLEETVPWWCPPEGFGFAMTADGLDSRDFIAVFSLRRGEWIDRAFARICNGPGEDGRELDWPQPEMVGSTISMITAHTTTDDAYFRFACFDGERHWGLLVSDLAANDGPSPELSAVQHKNSSPRLQEFKTWHLDRQDTVQRPMLLIDRDRLPELRRRKASPAFATVYQRICQMRPNGGGQHNPNASGGFRAIVDSDPVLAWAKKRELVDISQPHSLSILLGRDHGDEYSPVGSRPVAPWAEDFDNIAATGVFTPDEERLARAHLMLLGHMYLQTDFTNWRFNARNANFEADRADTVGVVGLCFPDNPDGQTFIEHAAARLTSMLEIYCTPDSGRWYENVACYYLQSVKCWCNLAFHLARHGHIDPAAVPKMRDFLGWAINVISAPTPARYEDMRDGVSADAYPGVAKARRIAPIGDHAHLGAWIPEHFAVMARFFRARDPAFADRLLWAYHASGADGGYYANHMLFFSMAEAADLVPPARPPQLASRRLQGFGAVFRGNFNRTDEFYLLFKQGPGGYRYHRSEGSFILCADGKPLVWDGGEAGETWRHSTLSFYDTHTMLAPGHVERFRSCDQVDFCQGVHPKALEPGEPDFLNNPCRHDLIPLAHARFHEPRPADARSVAWVKDEYVVLHDELDLDPAIPTHWHLQAVAHDETGTIGDGFRFRGRFGTDFQVLLPGHADATATVTYVPIVEPHLPPERCFGMRHLQVDGPAGTSAYLALIRPLGAGRAPVRATALRLGQRTVGIHVQGAGIDDRLFFARNGLIFDQDGITCTGRYAQVLVRPHATTLALLDGSRLEAAGCVLASTGPMAVLHIAGDEASLTTEGVGEVAVSRNGTTQRFTCTGERRTWPSLNPTIRMQPLGRG